MGMLPQLRSQRHRLTIGRTVAGGQPLYSDHDEPTDQRGELMNKQVLQQTIEHEAHTLRGIIKSYVIKFGLAAYAHADGVAEEVFHDTVVEALHHADRFDHQRAPIPWLLGIALNIIRMRRRTIGKGREIPIRDMSTTQTSDMDDDDLFQHFGNLVAEKMTDNLDREMFVQQLLRHVSTQDREIIHLAIWHDLDSQTIGKQLKMSPSAVRVRLHRAIKGLRQWMKLEVQE